MENSVVICLSDSKFAEEPEVHEDPDLKQNRNFYQFYFITKMMLLMKEDTVTYCSPIL